MRESKNKYQGEFHKTSNAIWEQGKKQAFICNMKDLKEIALRKAFWAQICICMDSKEESATSSILVQSLLKDENKILLQHICS